MHIIEVKERSSVATFHRVAHRIYKGDKTGLPHWREWSTVLSIQSKMRFKAWRGNQMDIER